VQTGAHLSVMPLSAKQLEEIDWVSAAQILGEARAAANPDWLASTLGGESVHFGDIPAALFEPERQQLSLAMRPLSGVTLGELPVLQTTAAVLRALNFTSDAPLDMVSQLARSALIEKRGGWLALLDLSTIIECWLPVRALSPLAAIQGSVTTLEHVAVALVREYIAIDGYRLDDRWAHFVCRRFSWGVPKATLDEIGKDADLTRERVRQVLTRLESHAGKRRWPVPPGLASALEAISENGFRNVQATLHEAGIATDDDWTPDEVVLLIRWFGYEEAAEQLASAFSMIEPQGEDPDLLRAVRSARAGMGLLRLDSVLSVDGVPLEPATVVQVAENSFAQVSVGNGWALVGDQRGTMLESAAARQFFISPTLEPHELYEGLLRVQKNRQAPPLPPLDVTLEILCLAGAAEQSKSGNFSGPSIPPDGGSLIEWLYLQLLSSDGQVLHKETLNRAALLEGRNLSSLQLYYTYLPIVRLAESGSGLVRLVGARPTELQMQFARDVAEAQHVATTLNLRVTNSGAYLDVNVGSAFLTSGILSVPITLGRIWPTPGATMSCLCDREFSGRISLRGGTSLHSWSPLIHHLALDHRVREGTHLSLELAEEHVRLLAIS